MSDEKLLRSGEMSTDEEDVAKEAGLMSPLRARSQRERKRNPFIFNDDAETYYPSSLGGGSKLSYSPRKTSAPATYNRKKSPTKQPPKETELKEVKVMQALEEPHPMMGKPLKPMIVEAPAESLQLTHTESSVLNTMDASMLYTKPAAGHHLKRVSKVPQISASMQLVMPPQPSTSTNMFRHVPAPSTHPSHPTAGQMRPSPMMVKIVEPDDNPPLHTYCTPRPPTPELHPTVAALAASQPDKKVAQRIGLKLRNLLKLPKAHKWVCYEWFYSNIDKPLFDGDNDFVLCLKESFPQLKTTKMTRTEWCKIRRLMGKPRRCSQAFFTEERAALMTKRAKIRMLQQRKVAELTNFKDLPERIPLPLVLGMKVTARLRRPQDGLYTGVIAAINTIDNTYRVTFDWTGLGTHSIADIEVLSNGPIETMPLSAFAIKNRPKLPPAFPPIHFPSPPKLERRSAPQLDNDPFLGTSEAVKKQSIWDSDLYGGFPIKFLKHVVLLRKILKRKKELIGQQRDMNGEGEVVRASQGVLTQDFQRCYAHVVLELERLNRELQSNLTQIQTWVEELAPDQEGFQPLNKPVEIWQKCKQDADDMVNSANKTLLQESSSDQRAAFNRLSGNEGLVQSERSLKLVAKLTAIMLHVKMLSEHDLHSFEFASLGTALADIKQTLSPVNVKLFEDDVEVHVNHIQSGLSQMGNLRAFSAVEL